MGIVRNADDFGKSTEINNAILTSFKDGLIDRTTIMVNMPGADEAAELAREEGFFDKVGLHFNLTEGEPLTDGIKQNPLFCGPDGRFHALFCQSIKYRLYMDNLSRENIYAELSAQLKKYEEYGFKLMHADSHHHVHTNLPIYLELKKLVKENGIKSVRLSRNLYHGGNPVMRLYKGLYNHSVGKISSTTDFFGSYIDLKNYGSIDRIKQLTDKKSVEIMLHPMYKNGVLTDTDTPMDEIAKMWHSIAKME